MAVDDVYGGTYRLLGKTFSRRSAGLQVSWVNRVDWWIRAQIRLANRRSGGNAHQPAAGSRSSGHRRHQRRHNGSDQRR